MQTKSIHPRPVSILMPHLVLLLLVLASAFLIGGCKAKLVVSSSANNSLSELKREIMDAAKEVKRSERELELQKLEMKAAEAALEAARHKEKEKWFAYKALLVKQGKLKSGESVRIEIGKTVYEEPKAGSTGSTSHHGYPALTE